MDENGSHGGLVIAGLSVLQGRVEEATKKHGISVSWSWSFFSYVVCICIFEKPEARWCLNAVNVASLG